MMEHLLAMPRQRRRDWHSQTTSRGRVYSRRLTAALAIMFAAMALATASGCAWWPAEEKRAPTLPEWIGQKRVGDSRR